MKTFLVLLTASSLAFAAVKRDVSGHGQGGGGHQQGHAPPPAQAYDAPPPPLPPQSHFEPPVQFDVQPPPQYAFQHYQPNYDPAWNIGVYEEASLTTNWLDKGFEILVEVVPIALSIIVVVTVLSFLGLIQIPLLRDFNTAKEELGRALASVDINQVADTVHLAIEKYHELFG
ncbi:uncharacterized protein LOC122250213 [Penaeus japonicus]|uniref:uncharacterized protein LOC122250213 n=1 Tax=Penaeus japonicus TaxID=27405 RepID=UPI001C70C801|nr:uncharacterized protein LOC122250213 [Penaeus japonicus]